MNRVILKRDNVNIDIELKDEGIDVLSLAFAIMDAVGALGFSRHGLADAMEEVDWEYKVYDS